MAKPKDPAWFLPKTCSRTDLAEMFGIGATAVSDLAKRGIVHRDKNGRYLTKESIVEYCAHMRKVRAGHGTADGGSINEEKAKLAKLKRQEAELDLAERRGEVIPVAELEASWGSFAAKIKSMMISLPGRLRGEFPQLTGHDEKRVREIVDQDLIELAEDVEANVLGVYESGLNEAA